MSVKSEEVKSLVSEKPDAQGEESCCGGRVPSAGSKERSRQKLGAEPQPEVIPDLAQGKSKGCCSGR